MEGTSWEQEGRGSSSRRNFPYGEDLEGNFTFEDEEFESIGSNKKSPKNRY